MPTATYTPIASVTLSASASEVVFSGLPQTYRDLILVFRGSSTQGTLTYSMQFNSDSGSNYSGVVMQGDGSAAQSGTFSGTSIEVGVLASNVTIITQFLDYSATDKQKTLLSRSDGAGDRTRATAARWASTNSMNSIRVFTNTYLFASGSTFNLFGVIA